MSSTDDTPRNEWEDVMSRELDERVRDLNEAPFTLDHVRGKATSIRRTRRLAIAGGVLAAAAAIVPVAVFAGQGVGGDAGPDQNLIATSSPSGSPTTAQDGGIGPAYLEGETLHRRDGSTLELPGAYVGGAQLGDEFVGVRNVEGGLFLDVIDDSGEVTETIETTSGIAVNTDSSAVAYLEPDGDLITRSADGQVEIPANLGSDTILASFVGGPDCNVGADGCRVYYNNDGQTAPSVASSDAFVFEAVPRALRINDADEIGLVTVLNKSTMDGSCGGLFDEVSAEYVWETCAFQVLDLSPDSTYVTGTDAYGDGLGPRYISILNASDGGEVVRFEPEDGFIGDAVWEDDGRLLATVYGPDGWSVYRIGLDESVEQVLGPDAAGDEVTPAYILLAGG